MLSAKLNGELINCYDGILQDSTLREHSTNGEILCPACGGCYEYCNGEFVSAYFRHKAKDNCDRFSEPETEEHSIGKRKLYEWVRMQDGVTDAALEGWVPETRQRPDIMFKYGGRRYVIEYQCTPIASEWLERTDLYESAGIIVLWVLGTKNYLWYQDPSGSKIKRFKKIEKWEPVYFDSSLGLLLCGVSPSCAGFKYSFENNTITDLIDCVAKWGVGTLVEKSSLVCANLSNFKFEKRFVHDAAKNERYIKVLKRLVSLKQEIYNLFIDTIGDTYKQSNFHWSTANVDSLNFTGHWIGQFTLVGEREWWSELPPVAEIGLWYRLDKTGMDWSVSICIGKRVFETQYMPTGDLRVYLDVAFPVRVRQILRYLNSGGWGKRKTRLVEKFDPSKPYECCTRNFMGERLKTKG